MSDEFKDMYGLHTVNVYACPMPPRPQAAPVQIFSPTGPPKTEVVTLDPLNVLKLAIKYAIESGVQESHDGNISPDLCSKISEHVAEKVLALLEKAR